MTWYGALWLYAESQDWWAGYNPHVDAMVCCAYSVGSWVFKRGILLFVTGEKKRRLVLEDGGGSLAKKWVGFIGIRMGFNRWGRGGSRWTPLSLLEESIRQRKISGCFFFESLTARLIDPPWRRFFHLPGRAGMMRGFFMKRRREEKGSILLDILPRNFRRKGRQKDEALSLCDGVFSRANREGRWLILFWPSE